MRLHSPLERYKPAASARTHLLLAAVLWTAVGTGLLSFGGRWAWAGRASYPGWLLPLAGAAGAAKGYFVLTRSAGRIARRIQARGDGRCLGGFISPLTWGLVVLMMGTGYVMRQGLMPRAVVGLLYVAIGVALLIGSARLWGAWRRHSVAFIES